MIHIAPAGRDALAAAHAARRDLISASLHTTDHTSTGTAATVLRTLASQLSQSTETRQPARASKSE